MNERNSRVTSEARARPRTAGDAETDGVADPGAETEVADQPVGGAPPAMAADDDGAGTKAGTKTAPHGGRLSVPLLPVLAVLLVLLLAATGFLWFTRPAPSSIRTADYSQVLEAARSGVVDLTSFDYLTLDDDIAQVKKIAVGDLQKQSVDQLNTKRQQLTDSQAVVNTKVVGAGVTRADGSRGTVLLVIESTQKTKASAQPAVVRYRIQVELEKVSGRWRLSGITGR
jgi:Mce-associated membrane protein